jgi:TM2 domain-containing membrane protein YozV
MKCATHSDVDATGFCRNCGKPLCPQCTRDVRGALYCEECLAGLVGSPAAKPVMPGTGSNPGTALALGFIPGLGAVYNGEYIKALIHVVVFAALIAGIAANISDALQAFFIVGMIAFYFYMPIEAYRVAKARHLGEPEPPGLVQGEGQKPIGAIVLIGLGVLFLLGNFGLLREEWFGKIVWPVGLIALGIWLLLGRMKRNP